MSAAPRCPQCRTLHSMSTGERHERCFACGADLLSAPGPEGGSEPDASREAAADRRPAAWVLTGVGLLALAGLVALLMDSDVPPVIQSIALVVGGAMGIAGAVTRLGWRQGPRGHLGLAPMGGLEALGILALLFAAVGAGLLALMLGTCSFFVGWN